MLSQATGRKAVNWFSRILRSSAGVRRSESGLHGSDDPGQSWVDEEDDEAHGNDELGHEHGLGVLSGLALGVGQVAAAHAGGAGTEGLADLGSVLGHERQGGGQVAQLVDAQLGTQPAQGRQGVSPRSRAMSRASRMRIMAGSSERLEAASRASGTPRPADSDMATRSR